jgi:hypothetical protein
LPRPGAPGQQIGDRKTARRRCAHPFRESRRRRSSRTEQSTTLQALIQTILSPYEGQTDDGGARVTIRNLTFGSHASRSLTGFALLLHELATNAAKYGALSMPTGHIDIACSEAGRPVALTWVERGGTSTSRAMARALVPCSPAKRSSLSTEANPGAPQAVILTGRQVRQAQQQLLTRRA